ncbi:MAG: putative protein N(5)-glutamine methyltransferase [Pseudonocardia sp.]|nr:putative protein N(5)-glutamine methyltransferase [Pseudonocardia sp.]
MASSGRALSCRLSHQLAPPVAIVTRLRASGCVFAEEEARLLVAAATTTEELTALVDRRTAGVPLEHLLGWAEFAGLRIAVEPGVFVPRRRTELLVHEAVAALVLGDSPRAVAVDLCCGSGAVGAAVAELVAGVELHAVDIDPVAVRCARRNLAGAGARVYEGDLYRPLPTTLRGRVDVLLANVPYVPTESIELMPPEARVHEPKVALDGGADGLDVARRVIAQARRWLAPGGAVLVETSERQAPATVEEFTRGGLVPRLARSDELSATVVIGTEGGVQR